MPVYRKIFRAGKKLVVEYPDAEHEFSGRPAAGGLSSLSKNVAWSKRCQYGPNVAAAPLRPESGNYSIDSNSI